MLGREAATPRIPWLELGCHISVCTQKPLGGHVVQQDDLSVDNLRQNKRLPRRSHGDKGLAYRVTTTALELKLVILLLKLGFGFQVLEDVVLNEKSLCLGCDFALNEKKVKSE